MSKNVILAVVVLAVALVVLAGVRKRYKTQPAVESPVTRQQYSVSPTPPESAKTTPDIANDLKDLDAAMDSAGKIENPDVSAE